MSSTMSILSTQVLVVLLVVASTTVIARNNSSDCFPFSNARLDGNLIIPNIRVSETPMSRHHIIPLAKLQKFFLITLINDPFTCQFMTDFLDSMLVTLFSAVPEGASGLNSTEIVTRNNLITENNLIWKLVTGSNTSRDSLLGKNRTSLSVTKAVAAYFAWFTPNIFVGPSRRSDDPGSNFETNARYIVGEVAFKALEDFDKVMSTVINNFNRDGFVAKFYLMKALNYLYEMHSVRSKPYFYNANNWIQDRATGRWRIKQTHNPHFDGKRRRRRSGGSSQIMCSFDHIFDRVLAAYKKEFPNHQTSCLK